LIFVFSDHNKIKILSDSAFSDLHFLNFVGLAENACINKEFSDREILNISEFIANTNCQKTDSIFKELSECYKGAGNVIRENYQLSKELNLLVVIMSKMHEAGFDEYSVRKIIKDYE
jgi:hypothetical protein